jgi:2-keto-4-pentenoate hydratase/2-oxohepta-3-ene-1,7-dioic acid hydratase in catechol pathway
VSKICAELFALGAKVAGAKLKLFSPMRLVTYDAGAGPRAGILLGERVHGAWPGDVAALLRGPGIEALDGAADGVPLADVQLLPPILTPSKIVCLGLNYRSHAEEAGMEAPETPTFFAKFPNSLAPPDVEVPLPAYSSKVDYEAEVAFVIGRRCKDVPEEAALDCIAGYTLLNDLSAREFQFKTQQWMPGKVFDGSAPCGPALVTPDEAGAHDEIEIRLELNGRTMQQATTGDLIHSIPALVAYLSMLMTLEPGDIVSTGTPAGVGSVRKPRVWLEPGDEVVIESPTLGRLANRMGERSG